MVRPRRYRFQFRFHHGRIGAARPSTGSAGGGRRPRWRPRAGPGRLHVQGAGKNRKATEADTEIIRSPDRITVNCKPADGEPIDLNVQLPLGFFLEATTKDGAILLHGMMRNTNLETETGPISITVPLEATRLQIDSDNEPATVERWADANKIGLQQFWAKAPSDALELKKLIETKVQKVAA